MTENGRRLTGGGDYIFGYNANSRTLRMTPVSGIWRPDSVYQIELVNAAREIDGETVEPVNDPPRLDPSPLGTSASADADTGHAVAAGGTILYTPEAGFLGTDTFQYTVRADDDLISDPATDVIDLIAERCGPSEDEMPAEAIDMAFADFDD